jgi:hypothetical protein
MNLFVHVEGALNGIAWLVYRSIHGVTRAVGGGIDLVLAGLVPMIGETDSSAARQAALAVRCACALGHSRMRRGDEGAVREADQGVGCSGGGRRRSGGSEHRGHSDALEPGGPSLSSMGRPEPRAVGVTPHRPRLRSPPAMEAARHTSCEMTGGRVLMTHWTSESSDSESAKPRLQRQGPPYGSLGGQPGRCRRSASACRTSRPPRLLRAGAIAIVLALGARAVAGPAGSVTGTVTLAGAPPVRPQLPVHKNREACGEMVSDDRLVIGPAMRS